MRPTAVVQEVLNILGHFLFRTGHLGLLLLSRPHINVCPGWSATNRYPKDFTSYVIVPAPADSQIGVIIQQPSASLKQRVRGHTLSGNDILGERGGGELNRKIFLQPNGMWFRKIRVVAIRLTQKVAA